jgi:hypothetical protein
MLMVPSLTTVETLILTTKSELASYLSELVLYVPVTEMEMIMKEELVADIHREFTTMG